MKQPVVFGGIAVCIVAGVGLLAWWQLQQFTATAITTVEELIAEEEALLKEMSVKVQRSDGDASVMAALPGCPNPEQERFEFLLGNLENDLTTTELQELTELFNRCGDHDALQRSVMVSRIGQEIEHYRDLVTVAESLELTTDGYEERLALWETFYSVEQQQRVHFMNLVALQGNIIEAVRAGETKESERIIGLLNQVNQLRGQMDVLRAENRSVYGAL